MKTIIKPIFKQILFKLSYKRRAFSVKSSWKKRFKKTAKFAVSLSKSEKKAYISKWKGCTKTKVNLATVEQVKGLIGHFNINIVPEEVFATDIEPLLNTEAEIPFFENKSTCEKWFGGTVFPTTYLHNINGICYDRDYNVLDTPLSYIGNVAKFPLIAKPNKDTYGGKGVVKINSMEELSVYISKYSQNYILQEFIEACCFLKDLTDSRPVSLRVCTYRSMSTNEIIVLNTTLRLGWNDRLDNETAGGIYLNIGSSGEFSNFALNSKYEKFEAHPNSRIKFEGSELPNYHQLISYVKILALKIPFARILSFDMILDKNENWRVFEVNILGQTIRFAQNYGVPFFGEFTDEVIEYLMLCYNKNK